MEHESLTGTLVTSTGLEESFSVAQLPEQGSREADVDVVIAGAGPSGLMLGCCLRLKGIRTAIVDPHPTPNESVKAAVTMPRTLELLDLVGVVDKVLAAGNAITSMRIGGGKQWIGDMTGFGSSVCCRFGPLAVGQNVIAKALERRFLELGGQVLRAAQLTGLRQHEAGVEADVERRVYARPPQRCWLHGCANRDRTVLSAKYLVGADGKSSAVRGALGIPFDERTYPQGFYFGDVEIDRDEAATAGLRNTLHLLLDRGSFVSMIAVGGNLFRAYYCSRNLSRADLSEQAITAAWAERFPAPGAPRNARFLRLEYYEIVEGLAEAYSRGRCFLVGDAAHAHSPAGGQGMNTGIQDAANLAWKLAAVLAGETSEGLLRSYERERRPVAQKVLATSDAMFRAFTNQSGCLLDAVRRHVMKAVMAVKGSKSLPLMFVKDRLFGLKITYRDAGTCADSGGPVPKSALAAGDRLPDMPHVTTDCAQVTLHKLLCEQFPAVTFSVVLVKAAPLDSEDLSLVGGCLARFEGGALRLAWWVVSAADPGAGPQLRAPEVSVKSGVPVRSLVPDASAGGACLHGELRLRPGGASRAVLVV
eukprot:CAMPEP_0179032372 /NCGR_PEP_ID=MMETSP0796-20121207/11549_1 /TAXON_ID=73915 /ORGANISM="Pyrodinium bahamense, Strain pbaha01" /LENGTH=589 /DNA_ID=CAMNT_0020728587 /DNA_START=19 /DNA_END=1784 /DNA_ORIENTATION=-